MNITDDSGTLLVAGFILGFCVGILVFVFAAYLPKIQVPTELIKQCQADLPRNQVCELIAVAVENNK